MLGVSRATIYAAERNGHVKRVIECASLALLNDEMVYRYIEGNLNMQECIMVNRRRNRSKPEIGNGQG